jgi:hypothetical protein
MQALPQWKERWRFTGTGLLRPVDAAPRFARRLPEGCGDPHHEGFTEAAECFSVRLNVSRPFGDIVIIFVDDDPAAFEVAETRPPTFDIGNFQGDPISLRRLGRDRQQCEMGEAVIGATDRDYEAGRPGLPAFGFAALVLPRPKIGISYT